MSTSAISNIYFGPAGREALAWLHRSVQPSRIGMVLCSSFGREDLCLHRSLRHFAESAASRGIPALRFDYPGSGDSAGSEFAADIVETWIASINDAVATLKQQTGVSEVCLVGVRLGVLLAACAASKRQDIAGLVAIAPSTSGRTYVRELKAYSLAADSYSGDTHAKRADDLLEAGGFAMDAQTQNGLRRIDLMKESAAPAYPTLIIERDDLPADHRWLEHLRGLGANAMSLRIPGYEGMVRESSPHHTVVPTQLIGSVLSWVAQLPPVERQAGARCEKVSETEVPIAQSLAWSPLSSIALHEEVASIDVGTHLTAVLTRPALSIAASPRRAIVLLSGGTDRRIGPGRLFVHLAREWAAKGYLVLRLDLSGVGDSPPRAGFADNLPYLPHAFDDIDAAVRYLREAHCVSHCQLIGHCAGAYNAFRAAVAGTDVDAVILINPLLYLQIKGNKVDLDTSRLDAAVSGRNYRHRLTDWSRWRALITNPRKVLNVLRNLAGIVHQTANRRVRDGLRLLGVHLQDDLPSELLSLARRNVLLRCVFSDRERGELMLWSLGGATLKRLIRSRKVTLTASKGADHLYTQLHDREVLFRELTKMIDSTGSDEANTEPLVHTNAFTVPKGSVA